MYPRDWNAYWLVPRGPNFSKSPTTGVSWMAASQYRWVYMPSARSGLSGAAADAWPSMVSLPPYFGTSAVAAVAAKAVLPAARAPAAR